MTEPLPAIARAGALARRFEELLKSSGNDEQFLRDVARLSLGSAESPWEALAAIDQMYRRGKLSSQLFRAARIGIERRALGVNDERPRKGAAVKPLRSVAPPPVPVSDAAPLPVAPKPAAAPDDAHRGDHELQQLRAGIEQARRDAAAYQQRLEQLSWPVLSPSGAAAPATAAAAPAAMAAASAVAAPMGDSTMAPAAAPPPVRLLVATSDTLEAASTVVSQSLVTAASVPVTSRALVTVASAPAVHALTRDVAQPVRRSRPVALRWRSGIDWLSTRWVRLRGRRSLWLLRLTVLAIGLLLLAQLPVRHQPVPAPAVASVAPVPTPPEPPLAPSAARPAPGTLSFVADRYVLQPDERMALIDLRRSEGSDGEVTVQWRVSAASAQHGRDYGGATRGRLVLAPGVTQAQIAIPVLRNPERRHTEFFDVRLVATEGGAQLGELKRATVFLMPMARSASRRPQ